MLVYAGGVLGGRQGLIIAFAIACVMNIGSYWFSDKIVLKIYKAIPVTEVERPELFGIVKDLAGKAGLPMPKVYIMPTQSPNAFATGRDPEHAAVAVTEGILQTLNTEELRGVIAHELGHIQNRDILIMTVAATLAGAISMLASMARWAMIFGGRGRRDSGNLVAMIAMMIVAPIAAMLIQLAISRSREFAADERGARLAGSAQGLADGLESGGDLLLHRAASTRLVPRQCRRRVH